MPTHSNPGRPIRAVTQPESLAGPPRRTGKRFLLLAAGVSLLLALAWGLRSLASAPRLGVVEVARGRVGETITATATGTIESERDVKVTSLVVGRIERLEVDEGASVRRGDILAALDDRQARASWVLAEAARDSARAALARAEASAGMRDGTAATEIGRTRAILDRARAEARRAGDLAGSGILSASALEQARMEERVAQAAHDAALARDADRDVARSEVIAARAELARAQAAADVARVALEHTRIPAPFDGLVATRWAQPGQTVDPSTALFSIVDPEDIRVRATFDEADIARLRAGQSVRVRMDSFPGRPIEGIVEELSPTVSTSRQESRTLTARIRLAGDAGGVRPGMSADPEIVVQEREGVLHLPTDLIIREPGAAEDAGTVWKLEAGRLRQHRVRTGISNWDVTEILSGLEEGDLVLADLDREDLAEGMRARPVLRARPAPVSGAR